MIKLMDLFTPDEVDFYIIITIDQALLLNHSNETLLNEGLWSASGIGDYYHRVDNAHFDFQKRHIHIAHKKHINTKGEQVSWNDDGTRHDKSSFNDGFTGMEKAKQIARTTLNLDSSIILESEEIEDGQILLESVENLSIQSSIFIFTARLKGTFKELLKD